MERNTISVWSYIAAPESAVYEFLQDLRTLDEWTLHSRMKEQVDEDTWRAASSGYQHDLYYHIRRFPEPPFPGIEWHCGYRYREYFQVYPTFLFRTDYIEPGSTESGVYFFWSSFVDPARRTPMIEQGISIAHAAECRSLKAVLERRAAHRRAARGKYDIRTTSIYIDAPIDLAVSYIEDLQNMPAWSHLVRPSGQPGKEAGVFLDEYDQRVHFTSQTYRRSSCYIIAQSASYPEEGIVQRAPMVLIPCDYAFGNPAARGLILQRITFWPRDGEISRGKLQLDDHRAELINIKRIVEAKAGNLESFARGTSYLAPEQIVRSPAPVGPPGPPAAAEGAGRVEE